MTRQERFDDWKAKNDAVFWTAHRRIRRRVKTTDALRRMSPLLAVAGRSFSLLTIAMALLGKSIAAFNLAFKNGFWYESRFNDVGMCGPLAVRFCVLHSCDSTFQQVADELFDWFIPKRTTALERRLNESRLLRWLALNCLTGSAFWDHMAKRLYRRFRK